MCYFKRMRGIQALFLTLILSFSCIFFTVKQLIPVYASEETDEKNEPTLNDILDDFSCLQNDGTFNTFYYTFENNLLTINATKIFTESDLPEFTPPCHVDETIEIEYVVIYDHNRRAIYLEEYVEDVIEECAVADPIPGLIVEQNDEGVRDVMVIINNEDYWLSDIPELEGYLDCDVSSYGLKNLFNSFLDLCENVAKEWTKRDSQTVGKILRPALDLGTKIFHCLTGAAGTAWCAGLLDMEYNDGFSSAQVDCWQEHFGYNSLYDWAFEVGTNMRMIKFPFDVNGDNIDDFILWAWKGDYLTLGAGAELGIYERFCYKSIVTNHWVVNKTLAMTMTLQVDHQGHTFIDHSPSKKQWWITGFCTYDEKGDYMNVDRDELTARYTVDFSSLNLQESNLPDSLKNISFYDKFKEDFHAISMGEDYDPMFNFSFNDDEQIWSFEF